MKCWNRVQQQGGGKGMFCMSDLGHMPPRIASAEVKSSYNSASFWKDYSPPLGATASGRGLPQTGIRTLADTSQLPASQ